jgi:threonine/homoserine/homoserine lactone efflux protein
VTFGLLLASSVSGAAYTLTPGPAFLALLGIGASQGRRAGALFLCGHFAGDVLWASLALVAILGARSFGALPFEMLGLICGAYLCWLGAGAVMVRRDSDGAVRSAPRRPLLRGLAFGLSNPKAYPVAIAMFTALLAGQASVLGWDAFPPLLGAACIGFVLADIVLVGLIGAGLIRRFYRRHALWVTRISGLVFVGFGLHALVTSGTGLLHRG